MLRLLQKLLGKKKVPLKSEAFKEKLMSVNGVGPEFADRLVSLFKSEEKLRNTKLSELNAWLPDHVAKRVYNKFRR